MDTNTHSFTHCCVSNDAYSLLQPLVCVRSCVQILACIHYFTHCCLSNHTDTLTHSLHSLLCVKPWIQIHSDTHFTRCCLSNHTYKYTHTHTSAISVCQIVQTNTLTHLLHSLLSVKSCVHIYAHSSISSELFNLLEPNVCVSVPHHEAECCEEMGLHSSALRSQWGLA